MKHVQATETTDFWVGLSTFQPGGGAEMGSTPFEKVYVVIEGEVTIKTLCGLLWNCTDALPSDCRVALEDLSQKPLSRWSYAAGARVMKELLHEK